MNKRLPKVFQNDIGNINNNERVYREGYNNIFVNDGDINKKISQIFMSPNHVYKTSIIIKTNNGVFNYDIIGRTRDSLITIDNQKIKIEDIQDIKIKDY